MRDVTPPGTLITVAPTGAETAVADAPALPVTLDALVSTAKACQAEGAGVIHVHVRDDEGLPTLDVERLTATVAALREQTDLVLQLSTGGAVSDSEDARLAVLAAQPDGASLTCGTVNFGDDVFLNRWPFVERLYLEMQQRGIVPEFECFEIGHLATVRRLLDRHGPPAGGHVHVDLVCGVPGAMPGDAATVASAVAALRSLLPADATFSATGVGRWTLPVLLAALAHGGHLRVGMEDTLSFAAGEPVRDNAQLVARAAAAARLAQRPPLDPGAARRLLGIAA
jgi:3-keto-5-aminohexanoate cleavage enzyme